MNFCALQCSFQWLPPFCCLTCSQLLVYVPDNRLYLVDVFLSFMLLLRAFSKSKLIFLVMKSESFWDKSKIRKPVKADEASDMTLFQITVKPIKFEALKFGEKDSNQESWGLAKSQQLPEGLKTNLLPWHRYFSAHVFISSEVGVVFFPSPLCLQRITLYVAKFVAYIETSLMFPFIHPCYCSIHSLWLHLLQ